MIDADQAVEQGWRPVPRPPLGQLRCVDCQERFDTMTLLQAHRAEVHYLPLLEDADRTILTLASALAAALRMAPSMRRYQRVQLAIRALRERGCAIEDLMPKPGESL